MMEKKHRCRLCFRNFANGRALGGHMRSHMMKFYAEEKKLADGIGNGDEKFDDFKSFSSASSSSEDEFEEEEEIVVQDRESETEYSKHKSSRRRSNRMRKSGLKRAKYERDSTETEALSSISETTPDEQVAHCLIMMSRDNWGKWRNELEEEEEDSEAVKVIKSKVRGKYKCGECNKLFRSYQALGGHRASHNKIKFTTAAPPLAVSPPPPKLHHCPFCSRIFSSGQALGGHKRSHFSTINNHSIQKESLNIDLNLPAPVEDDETSQIAVSAVSDAEFVNNHKG